MSQFKDIIVKGTLRVLRKIITSTLEVDDIKITNKINDVPVTDYVQRSDVGPIIESANTGVYDIYNRCSGGKNLLKIDGSLFPQTVNGLTFVYDNGIITVDGTSEDDTYFHIIEESEMKKMTVIGEKYILSGCPSDGSIYGYYLSWEGSGESTQDSGSGSELTSLESCTYLAIVIPSGVTMDNVIFKPMLRLATINDGTYVPYIPTNAELCTYINNEIGDIETILDSIVEV